MTDIFETDDGVYTVDKNSRVEKMTDQTIKTDAGKPRLSLVPTQIITDIARVREYGINKYGEKESWRKDEIERYRDAMLRHAFEYIKDPGGYDEESGLPHLWHLACNVAFLCELERKYEAPENPPDINNIWRCSDCQSVGEINGIPLNYCPNCGKRARDARRPPR